MLRTLSPASTGIDRRAALAGYRTVSLEARVAAATPHMLVLMLFEKLVHLLRDAHKATIAHDSAGRLRATERALAIIDTLDATLDQKRGGAVARSLHQSYALMHANLLSGQEGAVHQALASAEILRDSWREITPGA